MDDSRGLSIRPAEVSETTGQFDVLADRVKRVMDAEAPNLTVVASAHDEVSQRVAATLNEVHASFTKASEKGQDEIVGAAATLRTHAGNVVAADEDFAG